MNRRMMLWMLLLLTAATPAAAGIETELDPTADFGSFRTFAWKEIPTTSLHEDYPDVHRRIVKTMEELFAAGDLARAGGEPDLYWTYHARTSSSLVIDTNQLGYAYGAGWIWNPNWGGNPGAIPMTGYARSFTQGTLVVDLIDARTNQLIWRGAARGKLPHDRGALLRKVDTVLRKMAAKFSRQYRKLAKQKAGN